MNLVCEQMLQWLNIEVSLLRYGLVDEIYSLKHLLLRKKTGANKKVNRGTLIYFFDHGGVYTDNLY